MLQWVNLKLTVLLAYSALVRQHAIYIFLFFANWMCFFIYMDPVHSKEMNFLLKQPLIFFYVCQFLYYIYFLLSFLIVFFKKTNNKKISSRYQFTLTYITNIQRSLKKFSQAIKMAPEPLQILSFNIRKFRYLLTSLPEEYFIIKN